MGGPWCSTAPNRGKIVPVDSSTAPWRGACVATVPRRYAGWCSPRAAVRSAAARGRKLADVTPEQALAHPTWDMGPVITINSATLVSKGLEVIGAHLLFGIPFLTASRVVVRRRASCTRWSSSSTARRWCRPARRRCSSRSRSAWPGPTASPARRRRSTGPGRRPGSSSRSTTRHSRRWHSPGGRRARRDRAGRLQRRQRGVRRGIPLGAARVHRDRGRGSGGSQPPRRTLGGDDQAVLDADSWARATARQLIEGRHMKGEQ